MRDREFYLWQSTEILPGGNFLLMLTSVSKIVFVLPSPNLACLKARLDSGGQPAYALAIHKSARRVQKRRQSHAKDQKRRTRGIGALGASPCRFSMDGPVLGDGVAIASGGGGKP